MDNDIANKYKYLFGINTNDNRSLFFLIIISDLLKKKLELNSKNMYNLPYMKEIKKYDEWIEYCRDLAIMDKMIEVKQIDKKLYDIIKTFFTVMKDDMDITNNMNIWNTMTQLIRKKDKIIQFTGIVVPPNYIQSNKTKFNFNKMILTKLLKEMLVDIPEMEQIEMVIVNPIQKCYEDGIVPTVCEDISCLEYIESCSSTKNLKKCKKFLSNDTNGDKLVKEVMEMDICKATDILIKFGLKYNNNTIKCFETYKEWEERTKSTLKIKEINNGLKKYIELLIEKVNPISELRRKIIMSGGGIGSVMSSYVLKNPDLKDVIEKHISMEKKYNHGKHIVSRYNTMLNIFNNNEIFNRNNMLLYSNYYDKIHYKYLLQQKILLNYIEKL